MSYRNAKLVSDDGPSAAGNSRTDSPAHRPWRNIRQTSILDFVNGVMRALDVDYRNMALREQLHEVVWSNGQASVHWRGATYTGRQLLDLYFRAQREAA